MMTTRDSLVEYESRYLDCKIYNLTKGLYIKRSRSTRDIRYHADLVLRAVSYDFIKRTKLLPDSYTFVPGTPIYIDSYTDLFLADYLCMVCSAKKIMRVDELFSFFIFSSVF